MTQPLNVAIFDAPKIFFARWFAWASSSRCSGESGPPRVVESSAFSGPPSAGMV
jgi:hypothetical protein